MHAASSSILQFESRGEIGIATLNRPERLNAFDDELIETLLQFFASLENEYETRVLILTGAGRAFCAGLDLTPGAIADPYLAEDAKLGKVGYGFWFQKRIAEIVLRMRRCPQPILGAIHGPAVGGGMSIALACDLRVASPEARFACSFLNLGVGGGDMGSSYFLTTLLGPSRAADMMYSGRMVLAEEALQLGLVNQVVERERLLEEAVSLAEGICRRSSPFGLRLTKELINETAAGLPLETVLKIENRSQILAIQTEDADEAARAWQAREEPRWRDR